MESQIPTRVGLLGWPVAHSRSAAMHQAAFDALDLTWRYDLYPVPPGRLREAVLGLRGLGFAGANVTVPHKRAVIEPLDEVALEARVIGAVNTIVCRDGRLVGTNTDALGFLRALRDGGLDPRGAVTVLLGAGGAARAVLYALLAARGQVTIVNRSRPRADALARDFGTLFQTRITVIPASNLAALQRALDRATLLVNATSVGMTPRIEASPLPEGVRLHEGLTVSDLVYAPRETRLLAAARAVGARPIDGLGMLVHQGAAAFQLWSGRRPPLDVMRAAAARES